MVPRGWLKTGLSALVLLATAAVLADGFVIYSSWQEEWRARTEAARTAKSLNVDAKVKHAQVEGRDWYRVVVAVNSESAELFMLDAIERDWDVWYLTSADSTWGSSMAQTQPPLFQDEFATPSQSAIDSTQIQTQTATQVPTTDPADSRTQTSVDTVAPSSLVAEPLFSEDESDSSQSQSQSASPPAGAEDLQGHETHEAETMEPEEEPTNESGEDSVASTEGAGDSAITIESTLREVEMIQRQAQNLISNWVQREDETAYVLPTDVENHMKIDQSATPTRESSFNVLRVPDQRRR